MDKLSVIIPIYNVEPYLCQCLDSVINQTYKNLEIILIDDGSPDNCGAICDEYAQEDDRIVVIHKQNGGLSAARNDGIEKATGEWIAFVDSDDWCETGYYEQLFEALGNKNVDVFCAGGCYYEYNSGMVTKRTIKEVILYDQRKELDGLMIKVLVAPYSELKEIGNVVMAGPWDKLYRTEFIKKNALRFDVNCKACEDYLFNFQVFDKAEAIGGCPYIGYHYRYVDTSITKGFNPHKSEIFYDFVCRLYTYMEQQDCGLNDQIKQAIAFMCFDRLDCSFRVCYFHPANTKPYKEIAGEIKQMKTWPYFCEAIYSNNNQYFSKKKLVLKYLLRLPWVWPLKLAYSVKQMLHRQR